MLVEVGISFSSSHLTFFGFRSARLLSRRRRFLGSRGLVLEREEGEIGTLEQCEYGHNLDIMCPKCVKNVTNMLPKEGHASKL